MPFRRWTCSYARSGPSACSAAHVELAGVRRLGQGRAGARPSRDSGPGTRRRARAAARAGGRRAGRGRRSQTSRPSRSPSSERTRAACAAGRRAEMIAQAAPRRGSETGPGRWPGWAACSAPSTGSTVPSRAKAAPSWSSETIRATCAAAVVGVGAVPQGRARPPTGPSGSWLSQRGAGVAAPAVDGEGEPHAAVKWRRAAFVGAEAERRPRPGARTRRGPRALS